MARYCIVCNSEIPEGRLKILPHTRTCVNHSTTSAYAARPVHTGTSADDAMQDIEIIRDPQLAQKYDEYNKMKM
jgi:hypothetical protein